MKCLAASAEDDSITGWLHSCQGLQTNLREILDTIYQGPKIISKNSPIAVSQSESPVLQEYNLLFSSVFLSLLIHYH